MRCRAGRSVGCLALVALLALAGCPASDPIRGEAAGSPPSSPTHVFVITIDTTRADWLGCYGHPWIQTPNIDRFAEDGILFEDAITPVPETLPAHVSLMTGRYPHDHGTPRNGYTVDSSTSTLAERLRDAGYVTAGFVSSIMLSPLTNFAQGFDTFGDDFDEPDGPDTELNDVITRPGWFTNDQVFAYLARLDPAKPQFVFVHYWEPHLPYDAPQPYVDRYASYPFDPSSVTDHLHHPRGERYIPPEFRGAHMRDGLQGYAAEITYADAHVGALLDRLRELGLYDDALILLTSDHGETLWDHVPYFHHAMTLFDSTLHVPAIVKLPGSAHAGRRVRVTVSTVDWLPSILSYLGRPVPQDVDGRDLRLASGARDLETVPIFSEGTRPYGAGDPDARWFNAAMAKSVTLGELRLIERPYLAEVESGQVTPAPFEPPPPSRGEEALFDRRADPGELHDLLATPPSKDREETVRRLREQIRRFVASADPLPSEPVEIPSSPEDFDAMLEALGYAQ